MKYLDMCARGELEGKFTVIYQEFGPDLHETIFHLHKNIEEFFKYGMKKEMEWDSLKRFLQKKDITCIDNIVKGIESAEPNLKNSAKRRLRQATESKFREEYGPWIKEDTEEKSSESLKFPSTTYLRDEINKLLNNPESYEGDQYKIVLSPEKIGVAVSSKNKDRLCTITYNPGSQEITLNYSQNPEECKTSKGERKSDVYLTTQFLDMNLLRDGKKKTRCLVTTDEIDSLNPEFFEKTTILKITNLDRQESSRNAQLNLLRNYLNSRGLTNERLDKVVGLEEKLNKNIKSGISTMPIEVKPFKEFEGRKYQTTIPMDGSVEFNDFDGKTKEEHINPKDDLVHIYSDPKNPRDFIVEIKTPKGGETVSDDFINGVRGAMLESKVSDHALTPMESEVGPKVKKEVEIPTERKRITDETVQTVMGLTDIQGYTNSKTSEEPRRLLDDIFGSDISKEMETKLKKSDESIFGK
ncbi:MAG: hypothetical protein KAQ83_00345 [Nanoarchaeota archaeon]|nr:hypothetical protein [Nanoarchaeota archaeon]